MAFKTIQDLDCEVVVALGGKDENGKANPTQVEGYYLGFRRVASKLSKSGFANIHVFQTEEGNVGVWGKTNLDQKLLAATPGTMIRATFTGTKPIPGKKAMYMYKVEIDEENKIEVNLAEATPKNDTEAEEELGASDDSEESDPEAEEAAPDEVKPARAKPPLQTAKAPAPSQQEKVKKLLAGRASNAS